MLSPLNLALVVASMPVVHAASAQRMGAPQGFTALFNGNDLSGKQHSRGQGHSNES